MAPLDVLHQTITDLRNNQGDDDDQTPPVHLAKQQRVIDANDLYLHERLSTLSPSLTLATAHADQRDFKLSEIKDTHASQVRANDNIVDNGDHDDIIPVDAVPTFVGTSSMASDSTSSEARDAIPLPLEIDTNDEDEAESAIQALLSLQRESSPKVVIEQPYARARSPTKTKPESSAQQDKGNGKSNDSNIRFYCRYPRCGKGYASTDAVRKHCRQRHLEWLRRLGHGCPALYCSWDE